MMAVGIEIEVRLDRSGPINKILDRVVHAVVQDAAIDMAVKAQENIRTGSKTGRVYTSGPNPLPHQASAAGQSPADWTGELADSIEPVDEGQGKASVKVGSDHGIIELGTSRIAPRPYLLPAAEEIAGELPGRFARELQKALK